MEQLIKNNTKIKDFVKSWMERHEPDTFVKDENGNVMYTAKYSTLNLTIFFEDLLESFIEELPPAPSGGKSAESIRDWVVKRVGYEINLSDSSNLDWEDVVIFIREYASQFSHPRITTEEGNGSEHKCEFYVNANWTGYSRCKCGKEYEALPSSDNKGR